MKRKQILSLLLLAAMLASTACGGGSSTNDDTTAPAESDTTPVVDGYDYQGKDFGRYEFRVLNLNGQYGNYDYLDFDEQTGEQLDDAVYNRNRKVEDKLNITFTEVVMPGGEVWRTGQENFIQHVIQSVMSDEDEFDAAYIPVNFNPEVVTGGYLVDLLDIPEMHVYDEYWDAKVNKELTVANSLYVASSPLHLMTMDMSWTFLFNQDMMDDLKLEYPYQLVRDGKWTLDRLNEYMSAGANLNGDATFKFSEDGNSIYGIAAHTALSENLLYASNHRTYAHDDDDNIVLTFESEHFYTALDKIAKMLTLADGKVYYKNADLPDLTGYVGVFSLDRALFLGGEIKQIQSLRNMESSFGLVPLPKFDDAQENYPSLVGCTVCLLGIPTTNDNLSRTGFILDALTYESYNDVLPIYMDVTVSQKGLRNDDSIEMLQYIWRDREIDMARIYGIDGTFLDSIGKLVQVGSGDVGTAASVLATNLPAAEEALLTLLDAIESAKNG